MIGRFLGRSSRIVAQGVYPARNFSISARSMEAKSKFSSPQQYVAEQQIKRQEEELYLADLLKEDFAYNPKVIGEDKVDEVTKRPIPINVELLHYKPLRLPKTHGHEVAFIKFRGYEEDSLIRASEFAARAAFYLGIPCDVVKKTKTEKRLYTVIRSPFAQAKSKENFHRTTYNYNLKAFDATSEVIELWLSFIGKYAYEGVDYKTSIHSRESLDFVETLDDLSAADMKFSDVYSDLEDPVAQKVESILKTSQFKKLFDEAQQKS